MSKGKKKIEIPSEVEIGLYGGEPGAAAAASPSAEGSAVNAPASDEAAGAAPAAQVEDFKDQYLRAKAELANYQRRTQKEHQETLRYAGAGLVRALLPVVDDLERVIASAGEHANSADKILEGIKLTLENFLKVLRQHNVTPIAAEGLPFDPQVHEAILEQESPLHTERIVLKELARGYKMYERVLRPAKVIVSRPAVAAADGEGSAADNQTGGREEVKPAGEY